MINLWMLGSQTRDDYLDTLFRSESRWSVVIVKV
jgi:hypothetical protein